MIIKMTLTVTEKIVYPVTILLTSSLILSIFYTFQDKQKLELIRKSNVKHILEFAIAFIVFSFIGACLSFAGMNFVASGVYLSLNLVFASMLCKIVIIKTDYKLVDINIVSELSLGWGFISSSLLTL